MADSTQAGIAASSSAHPRIFPAIVVGGLIVGAVDIVYAVAVYTPRQPILIPQTIASGILGAKSYSGGAYSSALAIVLQFVISFPSDAKSDLKRAKEFKNGPLIGSRQSLKTVSRFMGFLTMPQNRISHGG
jgi:hypothetical protein